jgi:hypothetical protein
LSAKLRIDEDLAFQIVKSLDYVFTLLRSVLLQRYRKAINLVAKEDIVEKE